MADRLTTVWRIGGLLVQHSLAKMHFPIRTPQTLAMTASLAVATVSICLALLAGDGEVIFGTRLFLGLALVAVHFVCALSAIVVTAASAQESVIISWWRAMPLSDRLLGAGWSIPMWFLAAAQVVIAVPAITVLYGRSVNQFFLVAMVLWAIVVGVVSGRVCFVIARTILTKFSVGLSAHAQTMAIIIWLLSLAVAANLVRQIVSNPEELPWFVSVLGYPSLVLSLFDGTILHLGVLAAWLVAAVTAEVLLWPRVAAVRYGTSKVLRLGSSFDPGGRWLLMRLEITRLVRRRRVQSAILSALVIQAGLLVAFLNIEQKAQFNFLDNAVLVNSILIGYGPLLARGLSDRVTPYAAVTGCRPCSWAMAVTLSGVTVALLTASPVLVIWSIVAGDAGVLLAGLGLSSFAATIAMVIGFIVTPSDETGVGETVGMLLLGSSLLIAAKGLSALGFDTLLSAGAAFGVLSAVLVWIPAAIESARWAPRQ